MVVCTTTVSKLLRHILLRQQDQSKILREITLQENNTEHFTIATLTQQAQKHHFQNVWIKKKKKLQKEKVKRRIYYQVLCTTSHMILSCILWQTLVKNKRFLV